MNVTVFNGIPRERRSNSRFITEPLLRGRGRLRSPQELHRSVPASWRRRTSKRSDDGTFDHEGRVKRFPWQFLIANSDFAGAHNFEFLQTFFSVVKPERELNAVRCERLVKRYSALIAVDEARV